MIKILVVEDEKPISDLIKLSLGKAGYGCRCAYDGMEAANMIDADTYDLILLDIMLPKVDGFEVARRLRCAHVSTPILMLTARDEIPDKIAFLRAHLVITRNLH